MELGNVTKCAEITSLRNVTKYTVCMSEPGPGRPRIHADRAEKQRAYRERKRIAQKVELVEARRASVPVATSGSWSVELLRDRGGSARLVDQLGREDALYLIDLLTPSLKRGHRVRAIEIGEPILIVTL